MRACAILSMFGRTRMYIYVSVAFSLIVCSLYYSSQMLLDGDKSAIRTRRLFNQRNKDYTAVNSGNEKVTSQTNTPILLRTSQLDSPKTRSKLGSSQTRVLSAREKEYFKKRERQFNLPREIIIEPVISSEVSLVVVVCSCHGHEDYRAAIRKTWSNESDIEMATIFAIGKGQDKFFDESLIIENSRHGDILQINTSDEYENLSQKILGGFLWIRSRLKNVKFVAKADDDVYINVPLLWKLVHGDNLLSGKIIGAFTTDSKVIRDPRDRWSVPESVYPFPVLPPYVTGGTYVLDSISLGRLLDVVEFVPLIPVEDVFITGVTARVAGIGHMGHRGFSFWATRKATACDFVTNRRLNSVNISTGSMYRLYKEITVAKTYDNCTNSNT